MNTLKKNPKVMVPVVFSGVVAIALIIFYLYVAIRGIGTFRVNNYIGLVGNVVMYASIVKYAIDYFLKGKDVSLDGLILKFGIAALATLIGLKGGDRTVFILTAVTVFIVPYISASLKVEKPTKKNTILVSVMVLAVLVLSIIIAVLYILNPVLNDYSSLGTFVYDVYTMNSAIEWLLFTILGVVRFLFCKAA